MPFFVLPGYHDLNNPPSVKVWHERYDGAPEYYRFRHKDTHFLMVNNEDPSRTSMPSAITILREQSSSTRRALDVRDGALTSVVDCVWFPTGPRQLRKDRSGPRQPPVHSVPTHTHLFNHTEPNRRDYITTAMTGAMNVPRLGAIDHFVWVTLSQDGPVIANILLNGVLDKYGPAEGDLTVEHGMYRPVPTI